MRFIFSSLFRAEVSICGDVIGPAFPNNEPVILERMFPTGHGRHGKGTEYHAFNLGANTWQLHYFRLTNQLQAKWDLAKKVFEQVKYITSRIKPKYVILIDKYSPHWIMSLESVSQPDLLSFFQ